MSDGTPEGEKTPEHVAVFLHFRSVFGEPGRRSGDARRRDRRAKDEASVPYGVGRDPRGISDVLGALTSRNGWDSPIARAELLTRWPELVGPEVAGHTEPTGIEEGVLTVRVDSTAWATELRRMQATLLTELGRRYPDAGIERVSFIGPNVPSWKRGPRAIPGRGPRDTYG